mgnify:CR=1 FL=1
MRKQARHHHRPPSQHHSGYGTYCRDGQGKGCGDGNTRRIDGQLPTISQYDGNTGTGKQMATERGGGINNDTQYIE